jgi:hypothetical protein
MSCLWTYYIETPSRLASGAAKQRLGPKTCSSHKTVEGWRETTEPSTQTLFDALELEEITMGIS